MKLIVGLGNPESKYADTRHNIGRALVESIAAFHKLSFQKKKKLESALVPFEWEGTSAVLAFPLTWVNLSGSSVAALVRHFELQPETDLLVVIDDLALPFGQLRLRGKGSDGGHNGLKSVTASLKSAQYARLRIGIGKPETTGGLLADRDSIVSEYVLSSFDKKEKAKVREVLSEAQEACRLWISEPVSKAMTAVNQAKSKS